jgi:hypothetical protein
MYIFEDFSLLHFARPTNSTKVVIFLQKWPIFDQLKKGKKSIFRGRKETERVGVTDPKTKEKIRKLLKNQSPGKEN